MPQHSSKYIKRNLRYSITHSPDSRFNSSFIFAIQQPKEHCKSRLQMSHYFSASTKTTQFTELGNISTQVRLNHEIYSEQIKIMVSRFVTAEVVLSGSYMRDKCLACFLTLLWLIISSWLKSSVKLRDSFKKVAYKNKIKLSENSDAIQMLNYMGNMDISGIMESSYLFVQSLRR